MIKARVKSQEGSVWFYSLTVETSKARNLYLVNYKWKLPLNTNLSAYTTHSGFLRVYQLRSTVVAYFEVIPFSSVGSDAVSYGRDNIIS